MNGLDQPSNLHLHGMPMPTEVDDPHRIAAPGESLIYEFTVPVGAAGTYWYHPHAHGEVAWQLGAGLAGAMVVTGPDDEQAPLRDATEHVLVLQDPSFDAKGRPRGRTALQMHDGQQGDEVLVNGAVRPALEAAAGLVRLRVINASTARFHRIAVDGAPAHVIGIDGRLIDRPVPLEDFVVPPGQRIDVLVSAARAGSVRLVSLPYDRGAMTARPVPQGGLLCTLDVRGAVDAVALPGDLRPVERVAVPADAERRVFEYGGQGAMLRVIGETLTRRRYGPGEGSKGPVRFHINGREFDAGRVDVQVPLGATEIWEIRNATAMDHPFHLHIHAFQVLDVDGKAPPFVAWQDVVNVPKGSVARIAVPFRQFPGLTMYHCHILEHEDNGMMGHVLVIDPNAAEPATHAHHHGHHG